MNALQTKCLSEKEKAVVKVICEGGSNKEIAKKMKISLNTLKTHLQHIYKKLGIHSKTDLILLYLQEINPENANSK
ncbi:MAG: LuxR C-terminal-related transcriptional regulator [Chitinophagales bacterium]